jgi:TRAP-type C4-dicarboxylate transport system substrate-binding protein
MRKMFAVVLLSACAGLVPGLARAQQTITLKVADILPATHYIARDAIGFWMDEMTRQGAGRIKFEYYPAEQLGKARDMFTLLRSGAVDMAYIAPGYMSEKFPLSGVAELPRMSTTACDGSAAYWSMVHGGLLEKREFTPNGLVPLIGIMLAPSQLQGRGTPHSPTTDLTGMKVRGTGSALELTIRTLGGVPIQLPGPDIRQALERGTIDAIIGPSPSAVTYDHVPFLSYVTTNANLTGFGTTYAMSATRWKTLPADLQKLMLSVSAATITHFCAAEDKLEADDLRFMESKNVKPITLTPAEEKQLDAKLAPIRERWAASMKDRGLPGQEAIDAFLAALPQGR